MYLTSVKKPKVYAIKTQNSNQVSKSKLNITLKFDSEQLKPIDFSNLPVTTPLDKIEKVTEFLLVAFAR